MKLKYQQTRRAFITNGIKAVLAASAAPLFLPSRVLGQNGQVGPNSKVNVGAIGLGNMGMGEFGIFSQNSSLQWTGLCDAFASRREGALQRISPENQSSAKLYEDYRELLAESSIDAVVITTADSWHVPMALEAARRGKHMYVAKPLGYSLGQNRALMRALQSSPSLFYYGTQQRGQENVKRAVSLVRSGVIGKIKKIDVWAPPGNDGGSVDVIPVPADLNYELYTGPSTMRPCTQARLTHLGSYFHSDFSIGFIGGWGAHPLDIMVWACDADYSGPMSIEATGTFPKKGYFDNCIGWDAQITFGDKTQVSFMDTVTASTRLPYLGTADVVNNNYPNGTTFFGDKEWISVGRGHIKASDPAILRQVISPDNNQLYAPLNDWHRGFIQNIKNGDKSYGPIDQAVRSDSISHVTLAAIKAGKKITWDPIKYAYLDPVELNKTIEVPTRGNYYIP